MSSEIGRLRRENELLKKLVVDMATVTIEILDSCPDDLRTHENAVRMREVAQRLIDEYGPSLPAPTHRQ